MAIDEQARHALYEAFKASHGNEVANTLMELLPPVGWADVATKHDVIAVKHDLAALEERMELRLELVEARLMTRIWVALLSVAGVSLAVSQALSRIG